MRFKRSPLAELEPAHRALAQGRYGLAFALLENAAKRPRGRAIQAVFKLYLAAVYALYGRDGVEYGHLALRDAVETDPNVVQHPLYQALFWEFAAHQGDPAADVKRGITAVAGSSDVVARFHGASALLIARAYRSAAKLLKRLRKDELPTYLGWRRWSLLGQAEEALSHWEAAAEAYRCAVEGSSVPECDTERLSLAGALLELGNPNDALAVLDLIDDRNLADQEEQAVKSYLLGRVNLDLENPNRALEFLQGALALTSSGPSYNLHLTLGQCYLALGRAAEAVKHLRGAVQLAPREQLCYTQHECAYALAECDELTDAREILAEVLRDPSYNHRAEAFADLADVLVKLGDYDQAGDIAQRALDLGVVAPACISLGSIAFEYYRLDDAISWFEQAASASNEGDPTWVYAQQLLADVFAQKGPDFASRLLMHARAALSYTEPTDEWFLTLQRYLTEAQVQLGGHTRVLN